MNFNFSQFMQVFGQAILPALGQAVEALHPGNDKEALKINTGVAMIGAVLNVAAAATQEPQAAAPVINPLV